MPEAGSAASKPRVPARLGAKSLAFERTVESIGAMVVDKKVQFVQHYLECRDAVRAAELAGFTVPTKQGPMLLRRAEIVAAIESARAVRVTSPPVAEVTPEIGPPHTHRAPESVPTSESSQDAPGLSESQREACLRLLLCDVHETTEHYRRVRPDVFAGKVFTPGATVHALRRRGSLQPWAVEPASMELLKRGWIQIAARTSGDGPNRGLQAIFHPSVLGLELLGAIDEGEWAQHRATVERAGALKPTCVRRSPSTTPARKATAPELTRCVAVSEDDGHRAAALRPDLVRAESG